jgi:hypothetical protein
MSMEGTETPGNCVYITSRNEILLGFHSLIPYIVETMLIFVNRA